MKAFAPFRLDPANQCLWRATGSGEDDRILLTPSEFAVLDHLVTHAGRLVTHRELLDAVWPGTAIEPQAVKSKIFHLRRALDDDPKCPRFIETLPRRGYRFLGKLDAPGAGATPAPGARLVGREGVLAELSQCLRHAAAGRLQVVFVTGEPGIGKTAVAEEFQRRAASDGATRVARGQCVEGFGSKEGFYPVLAAVGELCQAPDAGALIATLATHAPTWLVQFPALLTRQHRETLTQEILGATRERMLREICEALEAMAVSRPLLLVLEDLHWADASTLDLISALARRRLPARIMLVATYRPTDVARSTQPLHSLKRDLVARQLCREIVLAPLAEAEIAAYLSGRQTPAGDTLELAALLHRHTEGNPLFMIAVLDHLVEQRFVRRERGAWHLQRPAAEISLEVPESLREMIAAQIERLGEPEQRVLEVASIAGMTFAPDVCAPSADMEPEPFDDCCHALARRGHILRPADARQLPDGAVVQQYAFAHALYREVLYARQAPARRATLHRRRAERLEQLFAASLDEVTPQLAIHFDKGADWPRAVKYLRRAATLAASRGALEEARVNLQHALELAGRLPLSERAGTETWLLNELADMYLGTFDARAADALVLLRERAARYGLADVEAKALVDLAYPLAWGSRDRGLAVIDEALRLSDAQADPLLRARIRAPCMMRRLWTKGWSPGDAAEGASALAEIRRRGTAQELAWHVIDGYVLGLFSSAYGRTIRDLTDALATLTAGPGGGLYLSYAHSVREFIVPWCRILRGEWGEAQRELHASIALAVKNGDAYRSQTLQLIRALGLLYAMDFAAARAICESLLPALEQPGRAPWRRWCLTIGGAAAAGLGNRDAALDLLMTAGREMDRHAVLGDWYWRLQQQWALANLSLAGGDLAGARGHGESFLAGAQATAERTWQALAWEVTARIALASGDTRRAQELVTHAVAAVADVEAPVAAWQAHATAADVARARGDGAAAAHHGQRSADIVLDLATSLGPVDDPLRRTFLAAAPVARVLGGRPSRPRSRGNRAAAVQRETTP